jgi:hypothetical protein
LTHFERTRHEVECEIQMRRGCPMSGDDLTIVLFLVGTAISFAVAAVSQAGRKRPLLILCFFVLAAMFAIAGSGWHFIKPISPRATAAIVQVATSPVAWFAVLVLGLTASRFRRKQDDKQSEIKKPEEKKIFIDVRPGYLIDLYRESTTVQGKVLLSAYINKWIRVTGRIRDVGVIHAAEVVLVQMLDKDGKCISAVFSGEWESKLTPLGDDKEITLIGRIYAGDTLRVSLMNCELI